MKDEDKRCKHCGTTVRRINFSLGAEWMHINTLVSFASIMNGGMWRYCKIKVAEPEDEL